MHKAVLPSGEVMYFPPETADHEIHAAVRNKMGLPPPDPDGSQRAHEALMGVKNSTEGLAQMLASNNQRLGAVIQSLQQATQMLSQTAHVLVQAAQVMSAHAQSSTEAASTTHQHLAEVVSEIKRPKKAVKDKDGSWRTEPAEGTDE